MLPKLVTRDDWFDAIDERLAHIHKVNREYRERQERRREMARRLNRRTLAARRAAERHTSLKDKAAIDALYDLVPVIELLLGEKCHVDHIVPISRGGKHEISNLRIIPARLNWSKNNRLDSEWVY